VNTADEVHYKSTVGLHSFRPHNRFGRKISPSRSPPLRRRLVVKTLVFR